MRNILACLATVLIVALTACGGGAESSSVSHPSLPPSSASSEPDAVPPVEKQGSGQTDPDTEEISYEIRHVSLRYPGDSLSLVEKELNEEQDVFFLSLVQTGAGTASIPRIDVLSVTLAGLTEETISGLDPPTVNRVFESFAKQLLASYYGLTPDSSGEVELDCSFSDTEVNVRGSRKSCFTSITVQPRGTMPEMLVSVRVDGQGENGLTAIRFAQSNLPVDLMTLLDDTMATVAYHA